MVAVGTAIAGRPPHRSVRAALPHTAPTLDSGVRRSSAWRTAPDPWDMLSPALSRVHVKSGVVLLGPNPSLRNLRRGLRPFVRLLHRYYGAVRLLSGVHVRLVVIGLPEPVRRGGHQRGLPVLVHVVSRRAGVFDYAGPDGNSRIALLASVAFPLTEKGRHPVIPFSELNSPARRCLCLRFA